MHGQVILKNIFSVLNILLILYLMLGERKSRRYNAVRSKYSLSKRKIIRRIVLP